MMSPPNDADNNACATQPRCASGLRGLGIRAQIEAYYHKGARTPFLNDVRIDVCPGARVCLLGISGAGKTTVLSILSGLTSGHVVGQVAYETDGEVYSPEAIRRRGWLGLLSQRPALLPWLSVRRNLLFPADTCASLSVPDEDTVRSSLTELALETDTLQLMPEQLSGGMHQRVAVARTLLYQPRIVLLDEALNALDSASAEIVMRAIRAYLDRSGATLVLVTHDTDRALRYSDDVYFLSRRATLELMPRPLTQDQLLTRLTGDVTGDTS